MGVYLSNIEMPRTHPITVEIYPNGTVLSKTVGRMDIHGNAVPVPSHGRLIDKDALEADISASVVFSGRDGNAEIVGAKKIINRLYVAPTVIEAEEGE